jgi:hypothetical protein
MGGRRVLLIDSDADFNDLIARSLEPYGIGVGVHGFARHRLFSVRRRPIVLSRSSQELDEKEIPMSDDLLTHDKLPRPKGKVVDLAQANTWDQVTDYILGAFHVCVDKIAKTKDAEQRLWTSAGESYLGAYMGVAGLKAVPGDTGIAKAKEQLADANHKADEAAAAAKRA